MELPKYYNLFDPMYGDDLSVEQLFSVKYDELPSNRVDKSNYKESVVKYLIDGGFKVLTKQHTINALTASKTKPREVDDLILYNDDRQIMVKTKSRSHEDFLTLTFVYSHNNGGELENQIDIAEINEFRIKKKKSNISLIKSQGGYMDLEEFELKINKIDLGLNYGEEFSEVHDTIVKRLNKQNDKGIVLLHGTPGTGKTTYIKHLTSLIEDKEVIFVPPSMAEALSDPSIIPFLMDYKNSILIIEDAERVLGSREGSGASQSTSNLLNLTDGILGDCLNILIIATFNTKKDNIDEAFMRKGRLIAEYKFDKLSIESTNKLLKHLKKDVVVSEGMVLSDIYNIDVDVYKSTKDRKIGFN
jgi:ATP-dependent 26S proteasome regulatory subunit